MCGRYEIVNVRTTKEGEKVPFLTGAGPGMARKVSFDNSALVDSVYDLAEIVSKTMSQEGPDILRSKPMIVGLQHSELGIMPRIRPILPWLDYG